MNLKGFGKKNSWQNQDTIPSLAWRKFGKPWKNNSQRSQGPS
jgi:hypothetical protein